MSSVDGSSWAAFFWATSNICLSSFITASSARTDFSRPTNNGTIMWGNTTISRNGSTASVSPAGTACFFLSAIKRTSSKDSQERDPPKLARNASKTHGDRVSNSGTAAWPLLVTA